MSQSARQPGEMPDTTVAQQPTGGTKHPGAATLEDQRLVAALRKGDEEAFMLLVDRYHRPLLQLAKVYVPDQALAEEVVQETWMGLLQGIQRFEERSSLKTWLFRILSNRAKTRAQREGRSIPFSSLPEAGDGEAEQDSEADRFLPFDHPQKPGQWKSSPHRWEEMPEERLLSQETYEQIEQAIQALPPAQREVITLRDIEGWTSDEVCNFLGITPTNQRVLLHRARIQVRRALERYFDEGRDTQ